MILIEWLRRLWYLLNRSRFERDLQQEMEAHREMMGEPVRFGNTLRLGEQSRDVWGWNWLDGLLRDLKYGFRGLRRERTFAAAAILTLSLGVATTTTVFSVVDSELWKPLPYPHPEQLMAVHSRGPGARTMSDPFYASDLAELRARASAFSDLAVLGGTAREILQLETAHSVLVTEVTANYFSTLGRDAIAGAIPSAGDLDGMRTVILTDRTWMRLFAGENSVIGRAVVLNGENSVISAIVRADDSLGTDVDLYVTTRETISPAADASAPVFYGLIGRLRDGTQPNVAREQLQAVASRLKLPPTGTTREGHTVYVEDLRQYFSGNNWRPLYFFLAASLVVLLLSTVNVATLLLARAFRRTREFALRGALGGGRGALVRHLLAEASLVTVSGAMLGAILTVWAVGYFAAQLPADFLLRGANIPIDYRVFGFVIAVAAIITIAFGITPMLLLKRFDLSAVLGSGARIGPPALEGRMRGVLLTVQIALTVVLLFGAGIFLKSFIALTNVPLGFDPRATAYVRASLSGPKYATDVARRTYSGQLLEAAHAVPGIAAAAIGSSSPLGSGPIVTFNTDAQSTRPAAEPGRAILRAVGPDYFRVLNIRIVQGREFSAGDAVGAERVAIVNETLVRDRFGSGNAVGRTVELLPARTPWTNRPGRVVIVGVVSNIKEVGINEVKFSDIYVPFDQTPATSFELIVRTDARRHASTASIGAVLSNLAGRIDPAIPVTQIQSFEERVTRSLQGDRFNALLVSGFALVALTLAAVGIYGSVTYNVQARTREFGVRLALGAQPARLIGRAILNAGRLSLLGAALGIAGTLAVAVVIGDALYLVPASHNGLLYGVTTTDPTMLVAAFAGILMVAILAAAVPAQRVARVDPVSALRIE